MTSVAIAAPDDPGRDRLAGLAGPTDVELAQLAAREDLAAEAALVDAEAACLLAPTRRAYRRLRAARARATRTTGRPVVCLVGRWRS